MTNPNDAKHLPLTDGSARAGYLGCEAIAALTALAGAATETETEAAYEHARATLGKHLPSFAPLLDTLQERSTQYACLVRIAGCDSLTGVANRRAFEEALARESARHERSGEPFALVLLDLDNLKQLNDLKGHGAGDQALRALADACRSASRTTDTVARLGGDEFAVLLPNADLRGGHSLAERLRSLVESQSVEGIPLRVSVGVSACCQRERVKPSQLSEQADQALYRDKHSRKKRQSDRSAA